MKLIMIFVIFLLSFTASAELIHQVDESKCNGCGLCAGVCPYGAATMNGNVAVIDPDKCMLSNGCAGACYYHCHNIPAGGDAIYKVNYTGINEEDTSYPLTISPLPCSETLNISGAAPGAEFRILNLIGRQVLSNSSDSSEISIDVSPLSQGIYVLLMDDSLVGTVQVVR